MSPMLTIETINAENEFRREQSRRTHRAPATPSRLRTLFHGGGWSIRSV